MERGDLAPRQETVRRWWLEADRGPRAHYPGDLVAIRRQNCSARERSSQCRIDTVRAPEGPLQDNDAPLSSLGAAVRSSPWSTNAFLGQPVDAHKLLRPLHFGRHSEGLVTVLITAPEDLVLVVEGASALGPLASPLTRAHRHRARAIRSADRGEVSRRPGPARRNRPLRTDCGTSRRCVSRGAAAPGTGPRIHHPGPRTPSGGGCPRRWTGVRSGLRKLNGRVL